MDEKLYLWAKRFLFAGSLLAAWSFSVQLAFKRGEQHRVVPEITMDTMQPGYCGWAKWSEDGISLYVQGHPCAKDEPGATTYKYKIESRDGIDIRKWCKR